MDEARAVINLKEGIIELQGPVEFVRHYLDTYQFAIEELRGLPKGIAVSPQKANVLPRRRKGVPGSKKGRGEHVSREAAIRGFLEAGFFDEPRSTREIKQRLNEAGLILTDNAIRISLRRLSESGLLGKVGKRRGTRYHRPGQS